mgnify:CR=1 FL=1
MCKKAKVTVKRAAEILGKSQQFVRIGLQRNILPFGLAAKKRQQEVEERMALLNKIKEDADKHNMSYGKYKEKLSKQGLL